MLNLSPNKYAASMALVALMMMSSSCSEAGAGVKKEGAMMSDADINAKLATQKTEMEAMLAQKEKEQTATIENIQKARAEAIELAEQNAEKNLAVKVEEFEGTIHLLNEALEETKQANEKLDKQLEAQNKRIEKVEAQKSSASHELPYTHINAKHKDLVNGTLSMDQIVFDEPDALGMVTLFPHQVIQLVSAIDKSAKDLQPYKQELNEILITMISAHHKEFDESPNTVFIEAKIRRAHIRLWTEQGQVYMAAISQSHPITFIEWLVKLNDEGLFGSPKAMIKITSEMVSIQVTEKVSTLVPLDQHPNNVLFAFFKPSTVPQAQNFGFVAKPIVGQKVMRKTENLNTYIDNSASVARAQVLNDESFQLVLMDKEGV